MNRKEQEDFSLQALKAGDRAEFARLVETYSGVIYRLAIKMLNNPQDAEDILQETFIKAYQHLSNFDGRSSLSTWLYRIATNEALMFLRKRKLVTFSMDEPLDNSDEDQEPIQIVDWCCLPEQELMSSEARSYMDQAIQELPHSLRVVFLLRDIEGLSTLETGEVLNLSETAVKTRLSRARMRLRELLTSYYGDRMFRLSSKEKEGA
ncbi:MAG TPA: sigma-70 family RNA polymerase sigma factor [Anaerolineales bacterium]|nr:sigma-70 family RNA polymerase sigma factor [Anaerolineales bacterium]